MRLIEGYSDDSNITIINTLYIRPKKDYETGKWDNGRLIILYKDLDTGEKKIEEIENPPYTFYVANDDIYIDHNLMFIEEENVKEVTVPYKDLLKHIAEITGNQEFYYNNIKNRNRRENEKLHTINSIFNSDMHIEDAYRFYFDRKYKNETFGITKAYIDIEVDTNYMLGDFPELGECPVNLTSYIDDKNKMVSLFILKDDNNPQVQMLENMTGPALFAELKDFIIDHVGGPYKAKKHGIIDFEYQFFFYDSEIDLIRDVFRMIHWSSPDFVLAWNMAFDIPYLIERVKVLGYDPADICADQRCETKYATYYIDERNKQMPAQRGDYFLISGKVVFLDQLVHFASRRKGQAAFENNKLDYIGQKVAKVGKLSWSHIAKTFSEFIRKDFKTFAFYNIMDTLVQLCIENKVGDIDYIFNKCLINNTRFHKGHRQTIYLTNRGIKEFRSEGFVMGNNNNRSNEKPPKFPGALVGDPMNNSNYSKITINGRPVNIVNNLDDFDYKSLYPSIMREFGIAPNTQIGKIIIENQVFAGENPFKYDKYCRGGQFTSDFHAGNYIQFCNRWFHLASYKEMLQDMDEYMSKYLVRGCKNPVAQRPLVTIIKEEKGKQTNLVSFTKPEDEINKPLVQFYPKTQDFSKHIEYITEHAQMDIDNIEMVLRRQERAREEEKELAKIFGYDEQEKSEDSEE